MISLVLILHHSIIPFSGSEKPDTLYLQRIYLLVEPQCKYGLRMIKSVFVFLVKGSIALPEIERILMLLGLF